MSIGEALGFVATVVSETLRHPDKTSVVENRGGKVIVTERKSASVSPTSKVTHPSPHSSAR